MGMPEEVKQTYNKIAARWKNVVFTGSRAIGCASEDSDWDFVVSDVWPLDLSEFEYTDNEASLTKRQVMEGGPYFTSVRIGLVNLIIDHRNDPLPNWSAATDYCAERQVFDKAARIQVFDSFGAG